MSKMSINVRRCQKCQTWQKMSKIYQKCQEMSKMSINVEYVETVKKK